MEKTKPTFVLSDGGNLNSHGFVIHLQGMDLKRFEKNPVMLYNHRHDQVIGRWENIRLEGNQLLAEADFDTEDALGLEVARKVERGYLKGCSVGIYIKNMQQQDGQTIAMESELMEASIVSVPSDAEAVRLYDENSEPTTFEKVCLSYNINQQNINNMKEKMELTASTIEALGIEGNATSEAVELAVNTMKNRIAELEETIAKEKKARVEELIARAIADKKIGNDEKETYVALAEKDYASVEKILSKMKGVAPISAQLNVQGSKSKYEGKTWDELDRAGLLASLKAEAPELYAELYKEKFNV